MTSFNIGNGGSTTFTDTTPGTGIVIDFTALDNSFNVQINGVDLFVGGPAGAENELEFQTNGTAGQTVRFADGDTYGINAPQIWQLGNTTGEPIVRLEINPDGTIALFGVSSNNGALEELELFNGLSVNSAAVAAAWNDNGPNTITVDQIVTGPTGAAGEFEDVMCFAAGTLIMTDGGPVAVENLKVSDQILTFDRSYQPIRWIGSRAVSKAQLDKVPNLKPILIRADALGNGFPKKDLVVSPQHRVLVSSVIAKRIFGQTDVLIPAKKLLALDGVEIVQANPDGVEYWHILFDEHQVIWSNGSPTESLFIGEQALIAMEPEARKEIQMLFPEVCEPGFEPTLAGFLPVRGKQIAKFVQRHRANNKPLFDRV